METREVNKRIIGSAVSLSRKEIDVKLAKSGDYVKMDYLQSCLKKQLDFDTKRFVMIKLAEVYEIRKMYFEAGKLIKNVADINTTFEGKMNDFVKSMELFIRAGNYEEAEISFKKAIASAGDKQKIAIKIKMKELYKAQAKEFMAKDKRSHALSTYEKIWGLDLNPLERKEVHSALLSLYEKLGKVREYSNLQKSGMNGPQKPVVMENESEARDEYLD